MGTALNTIVNGSSGTIRQAADFLRAAGTGAQRASDQVRTAGGHADRSWEGPARDAYAMTTNNIAPDLDQLHGHIRRYEGALRDLADSLDAVIRRMEEAIGKATAAGLRVEGPFIIAPDPPAAPAPMPEGPMQGPEARRVVAEHREAQAAFNDAKADYNAKLRVFNECKGIVSDARTKEEQAHRTIEDVLGRAEKPNDAINNITTVAGHVRGVVGGIENTRLTYLEKASALTGVSKQFTSYAWGQFGKLGPGFQKHLLWAASMTKAGADVYQKKADQYGKLLKGLPRGAVNFLTDYPTKPSVEGVAPKTGRAVNGLLKGLPYAGALVTAGNEAWGAYKGEQSWGKASMDTTLTLGGGAAGGFGAGMFYGFVMGTPTGPGAIITGIVGGIIGTVGGQKLSDEIMPPEPAG